MALNLLSCPLCLKPHFDGVEALRTSLISVATTQLCCPVCQQLFLGLDKLTIHLFSHIVQTNPSASGHVQALHDVVASEQQNVATTQVNMQPLPEETVSDCRVCKTNFPNQATLELHENLASHHCDERKMGKYNYACRLCSKQFKMRGSLMVHMRVAHFAFSQSHPLFATAIDDGQTPSSNDVIEVKERRDEGLASNKQWQCDVCQKLFTTKYFLKKHKRLHTGERPRQGHLSETKDVDMVVSEKRREMMTQSVLSIAGHSEMPYFCSQCNKYFTFQQSYHKHMLYHSNEKPHVCSHCGRTFKELSTLHNHERIHSGERPFACETCGKCFRQKVSYLVHRRIHTGDMPYKCTECNKTFRYKVSQRSHKCTIATSTSIIDERNAKMDSQIVPISEENNQNDTFNEDFLNSVLAPIIPNVESLCLGYSTIDEETTNEEDSFLSLIRNNN